MWKYYRDKVKCLEISLASCFTVLYMNDKFTEQVWRKLCLTLDCSPQTDPKYWPAISFLNHLSVGLQMHIEKDTADFLRCWWKKSKPKHFIKSRFGTVDGKKAEWKIDYSFTIIYGEKSPNVKCHELQLKLSMNTTELKYWQRKVPIHS